MYYAWVDAIPALLCMSLACALVCSAFQNNSLLACNLKAIGAADRPRYADLMKRLRAALVTQTKSPMGTHTDWTQRE